MKVNHFKELAVYQMAVDLQQCVFEVSKHFPKEERYALTDQVRRSSRSVGANLAEAWRKRSYVAHFTSKLTDSDAENSETEHWIHTAYLCGYIDETLKLGIDQKITAIGKMLGSMMRDAGHWCVERQ